MSVATGVVSAFDEEIGLGTVDLEDGRQLEFHATAIADGTRVIEPGAHVIVAIEPDHRGRSCAGHVIRR